MMHFAPRVRLVALATLGLALITALLASQHFSALPAVFSQTDVPAAVSLDRSQPLAGIDPDDPWTWPSPTPALPDDATLDDRLRAWTSTPVSTAANWLHYSSATLPDLRSRHNLLWGFVSQHDGPGGNWDRLMKDPRRIQRLREDMFVHLRGIERHGRFGETHWGEGRGIVIVAGNVDTFKRVLVTARMLREELHSELPVEVACFEDELPSQVMTDALAQWSVTIRPVSGLARDPRRTKNWCVHLLLG